jgi:hypothetical protein
MGIFRRVRGDRRRLGALGLAAAVIAGVVVVLGVVHSEPAEAFCPFPPPPGCGGAPPEPPPLPWPWPAPPTPGPWLPPPAPGGGGGGQAPGNTEMVKKVSDKAKKALAVKGCNDFVSGNQPEDNKAAARFPGNTIVERPDEVFVDEDGVAKPAVRASVSGADNGKGGGVINLWKGFYDDKVRDDFIAEAKRNSAALHNMVQNWTVEQVRAFLLLHEQAHLSGKLPGNHKGKWGPNQHGFHAELAFVCKPPKD